MCIAGQVGTNVFQVYESLDDSEVNRIEEVEIPWNIDSEQQQPKINALLATVPEQLPCEGEVQEAEEFVIEGTDIVKDGNDNLQALIASSNAMEKATMRVDPVEKIIEEQFSKTGAVMMANTTGTNMQGIITSAIQHALKFQARGSVPNGPQVQLAVGPPLHLPMAPPQLPQDIGMGNLNSFSHHLPSRWQSRTPCVSSHTVRSAPGSADTRRSPSLSWRSGAANVGQTPISGHSEVAFGPQERISRNLRGEELVGRLGDLMISMGGTRINVVEGETYHQIMSMILGVMGAIGGGGNTTTIGQFLNTLPDYSYVEGKSLVTDLFQDMVTIVAGNPPPATIARFQAPLRQFIDEKILKGAEPSKENIESALLAIADDWFAQMVSDNNIMSYKLLNIIFVPRNSQPVWPRSGTMWIMQRPCTDSFLSARWSWF